MRYFEFTLFILLSLCVSGLYAATYGGGSGTADDPYQIVNANDLLTLGATTSDYDKCFILTGDIDLTGYQFYQAVIAPDTDSSNTMFQGTAFSGVFNGNGHTIMNLTIAGGEKDCVGLFGCIDGGQIQDLDIKNADITGYYNVGGLAGNSNNGLILNCSVTGSITGSNNIGGMVGVTGSSPYVTIYESRSEDNDTQYFFSVSFDSTLSFCRTHVSVKWQHYSGGLVGWNCATITGCYAAGTIEAVARVGGLVGYDFGAITNSGTTASVSGSSYVGGLIGEIKSSPLLTNCYAAGQINATGGFIGGFAGWSDYVEWDKHCLPTNCFWDIQTTGRTKAVGRPESDIDGMMGLDTLAMKTLSTFSDASWDFVGEKVNGIYDYWQMEANDYPRPAAYNWTLQGKGTEENPYIIANPSDLGKIWIKPTACYRLGGDLDLSGLSWPSAVVYIFGGSFDGQGFVISNLTINQPDLSIVGLFGRLDGGRIQNLSLENVNITGESIVGSLVGSNDNGSIFNCSVSGTITGSDIFAVGGLVAWNDGEIISCHEAGSVNGKYNVGGIAGLNTGTLTSCHATGSITGEYTVGGLVGYSQEGMISFSYATGSVAGATDVGGLVGASNGSLTACYATGPVTGSYSIGGLVGWSYGAMSSCYATGSVSGVAGIGGLAGTNSGSLTDCYAAGSVTGAGIEIGGLLGKYFNGTLNSCFWDIQASGINDGVGSLNPDPAGVAGKTLSQMKTRSTFTNAGWDFIGETANGTQDFWQMPVNDYPRLVWGSILPANAANPRPSNLASNARTNTLLKWTAGANTSSYDIYFGTDPDLDPITSFRGNQIETSYNPGRLDLSVTYYWRVDGVNVNGKTVGKVWSFTVTSQPFSILKATFSTTKEPGMGNISLSGFFDAVDEDFTAAGQITLTLEAEQLLDPNSCIWTFPINAVTYKKGKFSSTNKGLTTSTLKIDTLTSKMTFTANNVDLTGMACPITVTITMGGYSDSYELNETIVNGTKPCPIQFMMGVKDTLAVTKYNVRHGKKLNTDSFTARGTFTLSGDYNKASPLVITLGSQTFTVAGGQFVNKNSIESCKKAVSSEGPIVDAKFDFVKCTYSISIKNANITENSLSNLAINCFGIPLKIEIVGNSDPYIQSSTIKGCQGSSETLQQQDAETLRFTTTVQGRQILFKDLVRENCCMGDMQLHVSVSPGQILLEEEINLTSVCTCICDFPVEAVLGPFEPGQYIFKMVQYHDENSDELIGQVPVFIE